MSPKLSHVSYLLLFVLLTFISACSKTDFKLPSEPVTSAAPDQHQFKLNGTHKPDKGRRINISNIIELYTNINDPLNQGSTLVLAPGIYQLSPNYPKGGRLEL